MGCDQRWVNLLWQRRLNQLSLSRGHKRRRDVPPGRLLQHNGYQLHPSRIPRSTQGRPSRETIRQRLQHRRTRSQIHSIPKLDQIIKTRRCPHRRDRYPIPPHRWRTTTQHHRKHRSVYKTRCRGCNYGAGYQDDIACYPGVTCTATEGLRDGDFGVQGRGGLCWCYRLGFHG